MRQYRILFLVFWCVLGMGIIRARGNEYWADANGSPDNYASEASNEDGANEHAEGGEDEHAAGEGGDELTPPSAIEVVQDGGEAEGHEEHTEPPVTTESPCQFNDLVKCLTEPLDEWAVALYSLKENIVAINGEECLHSREMIRQCIEEKAPSISCDHANILAVAERVTDLLVHKKKSGNLLRSYYVTAYVCTEEGRALRDEVGDQCLKAEHMGEMVFDAIKYMDEKISHNHTANGNDLCSFLRQRAHLMRDIGEQKCAQQSEKAGRLMCDTIKTAFLTMYPEKFQSCKFDCATAAVPTDSGGGAGEQPTDGAGGEPGANHGRPPTADDGTGAAEGSANIILSQNCIISVAFLALTTAVLQSFLQRTFY